MKILSGEQLLARVTEELGLARQPGWESVELLAAVLRRTAGFLCPCSTSTLAGAVTEALQSLVADSEQLRNRLDVALEGMLAYGDLIEIKDHTYGTSSVLVYAAPPAFFKRRSGLVFLMGITPDHSSELPTDLQSRVEYVGHTRRIEGSGEDLAQDLRDLGLIELSERTWLRAPVPQLALEHVRKFDQLMEQAAVARDIPGLTILDSARPVSYYRGRWVAPASHTGRFVGRRRQAYGADLWCYVQLDDGETERFIDLPLPNGWARGCDEAWRLQMAIDATRGKPQSCRIRSDAEGTRAMEFFSPVPLWARRRWEIVGTAGPDFGCLFSYVFRDAEISEEIRFAREMLWLKDSELGYSAS